MHSKVGEIVKEKIGLLCVTNAHTHCRSKCTVAFISKIPISVVSFKYSDHKPITAVASTIGAGYTTYRYRPSRNYMGLSSSIQPKTIDLKVVANYLGATSLQYSLILGMLHILEIVLSKTVFQKNIQITGINVKSTIISLFLFFMSVKSGTFSPFETSRPRPGSHEMVKNKIYPSWQPPLKYAPFIWIAVAFLRTIASVLVVNKTGTLLCAPIFTYMAHLCIGDTWNTINNVEKRMGTAVPGVVLVVLSVFVSTYMYWKTLPLAGYVLAPSALWLTLLASLVVGTWVINKEAFGYPSLFPSKEEGPASRWRLPFTSFNK
eukprot:gene2808-5526_t